MRKIPSIAIALFVMIILAGCGKTYEGIYNDYSTKLKNEFESAQKELEADVKSNMSINDLANSCSEKVNRLAEISTEGTNEMASLFSKRPTTSSEYFKWAQKLNSEYMEYGTKLETEYMKGAGGSLNDMINNALNGLTLPGF
ncbi:MAG: hypothetical protein K6A38_02900 [Lachnospiraceae bacterium]|nr:hypothetical protein [Lachnospiraceae bacterium]